MANQLLDQVVTVGVAVGAVAIVLRQCRKPQWLPGQLFLWIMNRTHRGVTTWGLGHVSIEKNFTILDVGCGGGKTIETLAAAATEGKVYGVDYSEDSVAAAKDTNRRELEAGRVRIQKASVSRLPFNDNSFDLVTAVETHYYWPDPVKDFQEILRVLKPGGRLVVIAETYKGERFEALLAVPMKLLSARYLTVSEHRDLFAAAGYTEIAVEVEPSKGWICALGRKPGAEGLR